MAIQSRHVHPILATAAITTGSALAGVILTIAGHKAGPNLMLGGLIGTSLCGGAIGYCESRASLEFSREMEARRLANLRGA